MRQERAAQSHWLSIQLPLHRRWRRCPAPPTRVSLSLSPISFSGAAPTGGFAFGAKYVGQVAAAVPGAAATAASAADAGGARAAAAAIIPSDLDGELAQQLQKLSKRDATTKLKALQVGRGSSGTGQRVCWEAASRSVGCSCCRRPSAPTHYIPLAPASSGPQGPGQGKACGRPASGAALLGLPV